MAQTATPQANGKAAETAKAATTTPAVIIKKEATTNTPEPPQELAPLEDRLHRLNVLFDLQKRFNRLHESRQKLDDFNLKANGETLRVTIEEINGNHEFNTTNSEVIKELIEFLKATITEKQKQLDAQIRI